MPNTPSCVFISISLCLFLLGACSSEYNSDPASSGKSAAGSNIKVVSHRGLGCCAPENSLIAVRRAIETHGADQVEIDVRLSKDKVAVAVHDANFSRISTSPDRVAELDWSEIQAIDIGSPVDEDFRGATPASLTSILRYIEQQEAEIYIDIKTRNMADSIKASITDSGISLHRIWFWSGNNKNLWQLNRVLDSPQLLVSAPDSSLWHDPDYWQQLKDRHVVGFSIHYQGLDPAFIQLAKQQGMMIDAYTVNAEEDMAAVIALGVDSIETDYPQRLRKLLP
ncbi:MAG: glycerophosphodiester phosphodiesterase family protein [Halioglobus sp.]